MNGRIIFMALVLVGSAFLAGATATTTPLQVPPDSAPLGEAVTTVSRPASAPRSLPPGESASLEAEGASMMVTQHGGRSMPSSVPPCQQWVGWRTVSPEIGSLHGRSVTAFYAELPMGPTCTILNYWARMDGVDVPASIEVWDDNSNPQWPHKIVRITGTLADALGTGKHRAEVGFTDCCTSDGLPSGGSTMAWTFTVNDCGGGTPSLVSRSPEGTHAGAVGAITVRFRDPDIACGLARTQATIEGKPASSSWTLEGNDYVITVTPPNPITAGSVLIAVYGWELCCNPRDGENFMGTTWWLYVVNCGASPTLTDANPKGTVLGGFVLVEARFTDPDQNCPLEDHALSLNGVSVPKGAYSIAQEGRDWVFRYYANLLPGPYVAVAGLKETCCNPSGGQNEAQAAWVFSFGVPLAEGEGSLPGAYDSRSAAGATVAYDVAKTQASWDLLAGDVSLNGNLWVRLSAGSQVFEQSLPVNA